MLSLVSAAALYSLALGTCGVEVGLVSRKHGLEIELIREESEAQKDWRLPLSASG